MLCWLIFEGQIFLYSNIFTSLCLCPFLEVHNRYHGYKIMRKGRSNIFFLIRYKTPIIDFEIFAYGWKKSICLRMDFYKNLDRWSNICIWQYIQISKRSVLRQYPKSFVFWDHSTIFTLQILSLMQFRLKHINFGWLKQGLNLVSDN